MAEQQRTADLAPIYARLAAQEAEIARLKRRRRLPRRALPVLLAALLVALVPLATLAANPFNDLNPGSVHNPNIDAIYNAGITTGCDPNVSYCPNGTVTREEMASFLARTAGLGSNPPVVNAKTAMSATNAGNANTVGGYAPSALVRVVHADGLSPVTLTGILQEIMATALTAPGPGFVLVTASITYANTATAAGAIAQVESRLVHTGTPNGASQTLATTVGAKDTGDQSMTITYVFPVSAAGPQTFALYARNKYGASVAYARTAGSISALYVPFGSTGGLTLEAGQP